MASFKTMLMYLKLGKKVRRPTWADGSYLYLRGSRIMNDRNETVKFDNINSLEKEDYEIYEEKKSENPMDYCMGCNKHLGFRGFCSKKCHDEHYEAYNIEDSLSDMICEEVAIKVFRDNRDVQWIKVPSVKKFINDLKKVCYDKIIFKDSAEYDKLITWINQKAGPGLT